MHANLVPRRGGWLSTDNIASLSGTSASGVPARARKLLAGLGIEQPAVDKSLPPEIRRRLLRVATPELLIAQRREFLISSAGYVACRLSDCEES